MVGYAMQTKGYRVWIPEEEKVIETCNVYFNESNVSFSENVNGEAVLGLNNKSEYTPLITEESESETEISEGDEIPCENLTWIRKAVPRSDRTTVDIYYGFEGRSLRLRSYPDVEKYCRAHNIKFNKNFLNFSGKDKYSGPVPKVQSSTSVPLAPCHDEFRGPRSDYVRQVALETQHNNHEAHHVEVVIPRNFKEASLSPDKDKCLRCFYCEKVFKDWFTLKEHMRKKQHKRINPLNKSYDRFYLINYLEPGKPWQVFKDEDDSSSQDSSGQECADLEVPFICLFCGTEFYELNETLEHMKDIHKFDLLQIREMYGLSYYKQIKFINYVRKKVHEKECLLCSMKFQFHEDLLKHLLETGHSSSLPEPSVWDQPLYYFSTFENDHLLWSMVDENSDCEECCVYPEDVTLPPRLNSPCYK
ncbi:zinc finger protein 277 [Trichonephila clavipes]|nr:zinc finger protein 277 [Trichonephila clavipes]